MTENYNTAPTSTEGSSGSVAVAAGGRKIHGVALPAGQIRSSSAEVGILGGSVAAEGRELPGFGLPAVQIRNSAAAV